MVLPHAGKLVLQKASPFVKPHGPAPGCSRRRIGTTFLVLWLSGLPAAGKGCLDGGGSARRSCCTGAGWPIAATCALTFRRAPKRRTGRSVRAALLSVAIAGQLRAVSGRRRSRSEERGRRWPRTAGRRGEGYGLIFCQRSAVRNCDRCPTFTVAMTISPEVRPWTLW